MDIKRTLTINYILAVLPILVLAATIVLQTWLIDYSSMKNFGLYIILSNLLPVLSIVALIGVSICFAVYRATTPKTIRVSNKKQKAYAVGISGVWLLVSVNSAYVAFNAFIAILFATDCDQCRSSPLAIAGMALGIIGLLACVSTSLFLGKFFVQLLTPSRKIAP